MKMWTVDRLTRTMVTELYRKRRRTRGKEYVLRLSVGVLINFFIAPNLLIILSMFAFLMVAIFLNTAIYGSALWTYVVKSKIAVGFYHT